MAWPRCSGWRSTMSRARPNSACCSSAGVGGCVARAVDRRSRLGKRYWADKPLTPLAQHGPSTHYLVYGSSEEQPGPYETADGTDFAPPNADSSASQPINYDYADAARDDTEWTRKLIATASFTGNHAHRGP